MRTSRDVQRFERVRINDKAPMCRGKTAVVAYIGPSGVSVATPDPSLADVIDYIPLHWNEFEVGCEVCGEFPPHVHPMGLDGMAMGL